MVNNRQKVGDQAYLIAIENVSNISEMIKNFSNQEKKKERKQLKIDTVLITYFNRKMF